MYTHHDTDLTYNRAKGVNSETKEFQDKVTVVRAEGRKQSWVSTNLLFRIKSRGTTLIPSSRVPFRPRQDLNPDRDMRGLLLMGRVGRLKL